MHEALCLFVLALTELVWKCTCPFASSRMRSADGLQVVTQLKGAGCEELQLRATHDAITFASTGGSSGMMDVRTMS